MVRQTDRASTRRLNAIGKPFARTQQGYLMVSLMIVLFVTAALMTLYVERQAERSRLNRGEQIGYALGTLGAGLDAYLDENHAALAASPPSVPGFADPLAPTAEELIRGVHIEGVAPVPPVIAGASYRVLVSLPTNCTAEQRAYERRCRPTGLAYIDKPLERGKSADYVALARATRVMKGRGGYSRPETASQFTFPDNVTAPATFPIANPTKVPGVLAWRTQALPEEHERLMTNGGNRMNNTLRLNGEGVDHDLLGARDITASGTLSSRRANIRESATVMGRLDVLGGKPGSTWGMTVENDAIIKGDFAVRGQTRTDTLHFSGAHALGERCSSQMALGRSQDGTILQCRGTWQPLINQSLVTYTWRAHAPTGFLAEFTKYREPLGNYAYCRTSRNDEWYDEEDRTWRVGVYGNSGAYEVLCFGKL